MKQLISITALIAASSTAAYAELNESRVKELIGEYLKNNPAAIVGSLQAYQIKQETDRAKEQEKSITDALPHFDKKDLHYGEAGNPKGDVLIVEFFDYNCPACKMMFESIDALLLEDKNVRVVFVEYPIFGAQSDTNAKISSAVNKLAPQKYYQFHQALMRKKGKINESLALTVASNLGIDKDELKEEIKKDVYNDYLLQDRELAAKLQITGTPAAIIGSSFSGGALSAESLKERIKQERAKLKNK